MAAPTLLLRHGTHTTQPYNPLHAWQERLHLLPPRPGQGAAVSVAQGQRLPLPHTRAVGNVVELARGPAVDASNPRPRLPGREARWLLAHETAVVVTHGDRTAVPP